MSDFVEYLNFKPQNQINNLKIYIFLNCLYNKNNHNLKSILLVGALNGVLILFGTE